jgi:hypothetical protein
MLLILTSIAAAEAYAAIAWLDLSHRDQVIGVVAFLSGVVLVGAFIWRAPQAKADAHWLFRPRRNLSATGGGWRWMIAGASGVVLTAAVAGTAEIVLIAFLAGIAFPLLVAGGIALALGYVR